MGINDKKGDNHHGRTLFDKFLQVKNLKVKKIVIGSMQSYVFILD